MQLQVYNMRLLGFIVVLTLAGVQCRNQNTNMNSHKMINPPTIYTTYDRGFSQAIHTSGNKTLYISGQVGWNQNRILNSNGNFSMQTEQAIRNILLILEHEGLSPNTIVHLRFYVVNISPEKMRLIGQVLQKNFQNHYRPATTAIGIAALARPELLVEIEAIANW